MGREHTQLQSNRREVKEIIVSYAQKLIQFNATEKYRGEMNFIKLLVGAEQGETVLDFGCGIGTLVEYLKQETRANVVGHDQTEYLTEQPEWFRKRVYFEVDKVIFNHSIAHVSGIDSVLQNLHDLLRHNGKVYVVTPNKDWIEEVGNTNSDSTVIEHYSTDTLKDLFERNGYRVALCGQFGKEKNGLHERLFMIAEK